MNKLRAFEAEHKALLEKTQYLYDNDQQQDRGNWMNAYQQKPGGHQSPEELQIIFFHQEFIDCLHVSKNTGQDTYLVDILDKLLFLEKFRGNPKAHQLYSFLRQSKQNLFV